MIATLAAIILALLKNAPAIESEFRNGYDTWRKEHNRTSEDDRARRDSDAVDAARIGVDELCDKCPFRPVPGSKP